MVVHCEPRLGFGLRLSVAKAHLALSQALRIVSQTCATLIQQTQGKLMLKLLRT